MPQGSSSAQAGKIAVSVGTSSTLIRSANNGRWQIDLVNPSDTVMWLALGEAAVANQGIMLAPYGGWWGSDWWNGSVNAIHENKDALGASTSGTTKNLTGAEI